MDTGAPHRAALCPTVWTFEAPTDTDAPRKREALLRANHMHDTLPGVIHTEVSDTKLLHVVLQGHHLRPAIRLLNEVAHGVKRGAIARRYIVVDRRERAVRPSDGSPRVAEPLEGLRRRHLVNQVPVHEEQSSTVLTHVDSVVLKDLVIQSSRTLFVEDKN